MAKAAAAKPGSGSVPGAGAIAGAILLRSILARTDIDEHTKAVLTKQLRGVLPGQATQPGGTLDQQTAKPSDLTVLVGSAAVSAAGLDPAVTKSPPPPVLWESGGNRLLVQLAGVTATVSTGLIEFTLPVSCDQTGDTQVTVAFATGSTASPAGGVTTTENRPRGDPAIIENWYEQLIAFAWSTLLIATSALSGAVGSDQSGRPLIVSTLAADDSGLSVLPMARHSFVRTDSTLP